MKHLDDNTVLAALRGDAPDSARRHLEGCDVCAGRASLWRKMLGGLRELEAEEVRPAELHRLQALFRERTPERPSVREWVAALVRGSAPAGAAVRGAGVGMAEYEAGPFRVVLELRARPGSALHDLHGQLFHADPTAVAGGEVVLTTAEHERSGDVDAYGEFDLGDLDPGWYKLTWHLSGSRIILVPFQIGDGGGGVS